MTLVELLVVLLLLGGLAGMSAFAATGTRGPGLGRTPDDRRLDSARAAAILTGRAVRVDRHTGAPVRFLPDGRAVGNDVDPLTGRTADASR